LRGAFQYLDEDLCTSECVFRRRIGGVSWDRHVSQSGGNKHNLPTSFLLDHHPRYRLSVSYKLNPYKLIKAATRTQAVHACTQYPSCIPRARSSGVVSTQKPGCAAPAQRNTASGGAPPAPYASTTASSACCAPSALSTENANVLTRCDSLARALVTDSSAAASLDSVRATRERCAPRAAKM
jgi:hypothetical protein